MKKMRKMRIFTAVLAALLLLLSAAPAVCADETAAGTEIPVLTEGQEQGGQAPQDGSGETDGTEDPQKQTDEDPAAVTDPEGPAAEGGELPEEEIVSGDPEADPEQVPGEEAEELPEDPAAEPAAEGEETASEETGEEAPELPQEEDPEADETDLTENEEEDEEEEEPAPPVIEYRTHVQTYGWEKKWARDGKLSGTSGKAKRLEGIQIRVKDTDLAGSVEYCTHVQTYGWETEWKADGKTSGTTGQAKRLEAIRIRLTGELAEAYDIYYCVHIQTYGWMGWAKNGGRAGSAGQAKRLEAIRICLVEKGGAAPEPVGSLGTAYIYSPLRYQTHVQTYGWQEWKTDSIPSGTTGEAKRLEGIHIEICDEDGNLMPGGNVEYRTHVQTYGWEKNWKKNGETSGTTGEAKRLEAIQIRLTGVLDEHYDIYYRVHAQTFGWMGWAKNGESSGTAGYGKRLEAIEIRLIPEGEEGPSSGYASFRKASDIEKVKYKQTINGKQTLKTFLQNALVPCGRMLYIWGGGWGPDVGMIGYPKSWLDFYNQNSGSAYDSEGHDFEYWSGTDCSGYLGWVLYNTCHTEPGEEYMVCLAQNAATTYASNGWAVLENSKTKNKYRVGDIVSLDGHVWISLGQYADKSVLLIHCSPNGVQISGTPGKAAERAQTYMTKYYPYWPYKARTVTGYTDYLHKATWIVDGSGILTDPDGVQKMGPDAVIKLLLGS